MFSVLSAATCLIGAANGAAGWSVATEHVATGHLLSYQYASKALGRNVQISVYLPPGYPEPGVEYPVLYLLHGLPGSGPQMFRGLDFLTTADKLIAAHQIQPLVVVAPSDGPTTNTDTEWINSRVIPTWRWGTLVDHELVLWADSKFQVCTLRGGRALGGISMGGFGAMDDALHALPEFGAVTLWSPYFVSNTPLVDGPTGSASWLADSPLYDLSADLPRLEKYPLDISFYVGRSDGFAAQDVLFAKLLTKDKIPYNYKLLTGGHGYGLWQANLDRQLRWLSSVQHC